MKYFKYILASLFIVALYQCNSEENGMYCYNCITTKPDSALITIKVTINKENPKVPVFVYEEDYNLENPGTPIFDTLLSEPDFNKKYFPTNKTYSVIAKYKDGNRTINAVDGGIFNRQEQSGCETDCWQIIGGTYDVRLKEY